ncbi:MAG: hypothetical protein ACXVAZ_04640 [Mucilaginibacter sp.]
MLILVGGAVNAQTHRDSSAKSKPADTTKHTVKIVHKQPPNTTTPTIPHSPVRSLSDEKYNALLKGEGFEDMSLVGELNHYPLPDKALKYKVQLGLNPGQITKLKELASNLQRKKKEMGENIIRNERLLDTLFHTKEIVDGTIIFYTNRYGLYMGETRNAVLQACLSTEEILSDTQIKKLEGLMKTN